MRSANPVESLLVKYKYVPDRVTGPNSNVMVNVYSTYYRIVYRGDGSLGFMPRPTCVTSAVADLEPGSSFTDLHFGWSGLAYRMLTLQRTTASLPSVPSSRLSAALAGLTAQLDCQIACGKAMGITLSGHRRAALSSEGQCFVTDGAASWSTRRFFTSPNGGDSRVSALPPSRVELDPLVVAMGCQMVPVLTVLAHDTGIRHGATYWLLGARRSHPS